MLNEAVMESATLAEVDVRRIVREEVESAHRTHSTSRAPKGT